MNPGRLVILTNLYLDPRTKLPFTGGEQRIYLELIRQAQRRGWTVVVLQEDRDEPWSFRSEEGVDVHACCRRRWWGRLPRPRFGRMMVERFLPPVSGPQVLLSSYPDYLSNLLHHRPWLYQHGVGWDGNSASDRRRTLADHLRLWPQLEGIIAVDTNYPNVIASHLGPQDVSIFYNKVRFIPNFQKMVPTPLPPIGPEGIRFLFPRNFAVGRGIFLVAEAANHLWSKGLRFHLTLCGQPIREDSKDAARMRELLMPWEARGCLTYTQLPFDRMYEAFQACHIALVPTLMSEGTSLSCLEAFGTGRPVMGTWVGGLQNLLIDQVNGRMLPPSMDALKDSMNEVITHPDILFRWQEGALLTAARFTKGIWDEAIQAWLADREG